MNTISLVIIILSISICILLAVIVYNKTTRWITAFIVPLLCIAGYLGWSSAEDLKGHATSKVYSDNAMFLGSVANPPQRIYVWIQPLDTNEPLLMSLPFTEKLARRMAQANKDVCDGKPQATKGTPGNKESGDEDENDESGQRSTPSLEVYDFNILIGPMK